MESAPVVANAWHHAKLSDAHKMDSAWREMVNNPDKLDALVNSMASCLSRVLSLRNAEVDNGRLPLGQALYQEKEHFPTREQLEELENIQRAQAFVIKAHRTASELRNAAHAKQNVLLTPFQEAETFCFSWTFKRSLDDGSESVLRVGGLRRAAFRDVFLQVSRWLTECDASMLVAFKDVACEAAPAAAEEASFKQFVQDMAVDIASRLTLMPCDCDEPDDGLSTQALQSRAHTATGRHSVEAEKFHRDDMLALRSFEVLAREGPLGASGAVVMHARLAHIQYVVRQPPVELGMSGANAQHMNLALLARACDPQVDVQVRLDMTRQWHEWHGLFAATAAQQALQKMRMWQKDSWQKPFMRVLCAPDTDVPKGAVDMPTMPFVHTAHRWKFATKGNERTCFDWMGRRYVRLTSLVLQLLGWGELERGVVNASVISPIATQAVLESRVVFKLLGIKSDSYQIGTGLLKFCEDVTDMESHMASSVSETLLHISHFSTIELLAVFSPQSPAMRAIIGELTLRTRSLLTFNMPAQYIGFAYDAMSVLLPIVRARRERAGIGLSQRTNPISELLKTVPRVRNWTPLKGVLRLEASDVRAAPPLLKYVLEELERRDLLVKYKRPYLGKQVYATRKAFVFDNAQLVAVLSGYPLVRTRP